MIVVALDKSRWRPLIDADLSAEVRVELSAAKPEHATLVRWWQEKFSNQSGIAMPTRSPEELVAFAQWLSFQDAHSDVLINSRRETQRRHLLFNCFSTKVSLLAQRGCQICSGTRPSEELYPIHIIPIRLTPRSRQVMKKEIFKAFQAAIADWLSRRSVEPSPTGRYCVAFTFAMREDAKDRDLDNLVKALQDAVSRALKFDDRHIHHLDVIKLIHSASEEYIYVRLAPSALNEHNDVLAPVENHAWGVGEALKLDDFL